jgi:histidyl-tRNA synthetase
LQVLLQSTPTHSGAMYTSAVAAGGRYDALLRSLWSPAAATLMPPPGAVGVSINCEKIVKMLLQKRRHKAGAAHSHGGAAAGFAGVGLEGGGRLPAGQCDVVVCARGEDGMLQVSRNSGFGEGKVGRQRFRDAETLSMYHAADADGCKLLCCREISEDAGCLTCTLVLLLL